MLIFRLEFLDFRELINYLVFYLFIWCICVEGFGAGLEYREG